MNKKIFSKSLIHTVFILLIFASVIQFHSILSFASEDGWNYEQLQKIDKTKNKFSFAVFGDTRDSAKIFEILLDKLNQEDVIFAIDVGDFVSHGAKEEFRLFINQVKRINKPFLTVIGNHETYVNGRMNYYRLFGKSYYSFCFGGSYFIILDNADGAQLDQG